MSDKLFDDNSRRKLISTMDFKTLNEYLKNMDRMAKRKGGKYSEMYNKDLDYIMSVNDTEYQDGCSLINLCDNTNKVIDQEKDITMTEQVCDTDAYVQRINNIINKAPQKEIELNTIKVKLMKNNDKQCIHRFIDIIKTIDNSTTQDEYNLIKELTKMITNNKVLLKDSFEYMGKNMDKSIVSQEIVQKLSGLRSNKNKMDKSKYNNEKDMMIKYYIKKNGFKIVCASKLVDKIIYASRGNSVKNRHKVF